MLITNDAKDKHLSAFTNVIKLILFIYLCKKKTFLIAYYAPVIFLSTKNIPVLMEFKFQQENTSEEFGSSTVVYQVKPPTCSANIP